MAEIATLLQQIIISEVAQVMFLFFIVMIFMIVLFDTIK
jgi:hypothetical protein